MSEGDPEVRGMPPDDEDTATAASERQRRGDEPDVLLDVSQLHVDEIELEVEDLQARVSLEANVLELLKLHVGVDASLGRVKLTIKGVDAKVLLKVRLDNVARIIDRVLTTIDNNPDIVENLLENVGEAVGEVGAGAGQAVGEVGAGAGQAVGEVGAGAGQAVGDVGAAAGEAVGEVGGAAGQVAGAVGDVASGEDDDAERAPRRPARKRASSEGGAAPRSSDAEDPEEPPRRRADAQSRTRGAKGRPRGRGRDEQ